MMFLRCCCPVVVVDAAAASIRPRRLARRAGGQRIRHVRGFVVVSSVLVGTIRHGASPSGADVDALAVTKSIGRRVVGAAGIVVVRGASSSLRPELTPRILLLLCDVAAVVAGAAVAQVHVEGAHGAGGVIVIVIAIAVPITRIVKQPGPRVPDDHLLHRGRYFDRDAASLLRRGGGDGGGGDGPAAVGVAAVELRQRLGLGGVRRVLVVPLGVLVLSATKVGAPARAAAEPPAQRRGGARRQVVVAAIVIAAAAVVAAGIWDAAGSAGAAVAGLLRGYDGGSGAGGIGGLGPSPQRRISCLRGERFHRAVLSIALLRRYLLCCSTLTPAYLNADGRWPAGIESKIWIAGR